MSETRPSETRAVERAARRAIARTKARADEEVTPDDLLAGALMEMSRFGVAWVGEWAIDTRALENGAPEDDRAPDAGAEGGAGTDPATTYSRDAVELFERAAALAREEGATGIGLIHLLAAIAEADCGLMADLRRRYGFSDVQWRAALAREQVVLPPRVSGAFGTGDRGTNAGRSATRETLLSVDQAAEVLGVHAQTVRNYIRSGKLVAYRLAGERYIRVLRKDLLSLLEQVPTDASEAAGERTPEIE